MGQASSQVEERKGGPSSCHQRDIYELNPAELYELWMEGSPLTVQEIRQAVKDHSLKEKTANKQENDVFYNSKEEDGTPDTKLAMVLNEILSDSLGQLRFRMVPGIIKEPVFWAATILLLKERLLARGKKRTEHSRSSTASDDDDSSYEDEGDESSFSVSHDELSYDDTRDAVGSDHPTHDLVRQLLVKDRHLGQLQKRVVALEAELRKTKAKTAAPKHKGQWIMDDDSRAFLEYEDDLKSNMRAEKQKRLKQVQEDMKFILDSDRVEDTNGCWNCCGQTSYSAECRC